MQLNEIREAFYEWKRSLGNEHVKQSCFIACVLTLPLFCCWLQSRFHASWKREADVNSESQTSFLPSTPLQLAASQRRELQVYFGIKWALWKSLSLFHWLSAYHYTKDSCRLVPLLWQMWLGPYVLPGAGHRCQTRIEKKTVSPLGSRAALHLP